MIRIASHNNNYHRFVKENASYAIITVNGVEYILYPDKYGKFLFNTREVSYFLFDYKDVFNYEKNLIDKNQSKVVFFKIDIYHETDISNTVTKIDTKNFKTTFFNGVFQRWECPSVADGVVNLSDIKMPYFEGYPFEYSEVKGADVERVLVDDGSGLGVDENVRIIRRNCCNDGYYLKWHNGKWGYSYYLFDRIGQEKLSAKSVGELREQFSWTDNGLELGKEAQREIQLFKQVDYADRELMKSLMTSNEVYLYTGRNGQKATANDWLEVRVKGGVKETNKNGTFKQVVTLLLPKEQVRSRI